MARRHFDERGFPRLGKIIREICQYVEGLEVEYTDYPFSGNVIDPRNMRHGNRILRTGVDFVQGLSDRPFKVTGIYVVGGQVAYLPDSYRAGEHDLDLIIKTNVDAETITSNDVEVEIIHNLGNLLNDGQGCWADRNTKEFALDLTFCADPDNPLKPPYFQIYPKMKKVVS